MVAPGYIAVKAEPGTHQAIFTYRPPSYRFSLMVMGVLILLVLMGLYLSE
jgi:uncharacterized membrane protein YfhO